MQDRKPKQNKKHRQKENNSFSALCIRIKFRVSCKRKRKREREMLRKLGKDAAHLIATLASEILANLLGFFYLKKLKEVHYAL